MFGRRRFVPLPLVVPPLGGICCAGPPGHHVRIGRRDYEPLDFALPRAYDNLDSDAWRIPAPWVGERQPSLRCGMLLSLFHLPTLQPSDLAGDIMATVLAENPVSEATSRFLERAGNLWINGQWRAARLGETFEVYNPATGEIIAHCAAGDKADIDAAVHAARRAFESGPWSRMTPSERGRLIWKLGDLVEEHGDELAELETLDNGKPLAVARAADVPLAVDLFRYMAGWATKIHGQTIPISVRRQRVLQLHGPRADRRGRADHPLELPALDGRLEARPCPGGGLHRRAQAGRADAAQRAAAGRVDRGSGLPGGRGQYRYRTGRDGRRGAGRPSATSTRSPSPARPRSAA